MSQPPADTTITLDPVAVPHDGETESDAVVDGAPAAWTRILAMSRGLVMLT